MQSLSSIIQVWVKIKECLLFLAYVLEGYNIHKGYKINMREVANRKKQPCGIMSVLLLFDNQLSTVFMVCQICRNICGEEVLYTCALSEIVRTLSAS